MNRIKDLRAEKQINQDVLAKLLGLEISGVSKLETGRVPLKDEYIIKLSEFFCVSTDYLLGKSDIRNPESNFLTKEDLEFAAGVKSLSDTNRMIIKNTMEALIIKQEQDEENKDEKK